MQDEVAIIGSGQAGATLAACLRSDGFDGRIRLLGQEAHLPYQRPPLSKDFLNRAADAPALLRSERFYHDHEIDLIPGNPVREIDLQGRRLMLETGHTLPFTRLAVTTGGRPRRLPATDGLEGIFHLRTMDDAEAIRRALVEQTRIVIVGGGFIGLELAATLSALGHGVTVLEAGSSLMGRAVAPETSAHFRRLHQEWGVEVLVGERPERFADDGGRLVSVTTSSGRVLAATIAVVGIGIVPNVELCAAAGLDCPDGVAVDECMAAGPQWVVAAGDCARFPHAPSGRRLRIESVQNASDQARCAAGSLLGRRRAYEAVPWFWSQQRDQRLQMTGIGIDADRSVVRGDPEAGAFSVFRYCGDRLLAVDSVNRPAEHMTARKLIGQDRQPSGEQAADTDFDLKSLLAS